MNSAPVGNDRAWDGGQQAWGANLLPPPPAMVPPTLTRASGKYKRHAWVAVLGLLTFVSVYLALTGWFLFTAYRLLSELFRGQTHNPLGNIAGGGLCALLGAFLLLALFLIRSGGKDKDMEVTAQQEPQLFAFLNALADRAGAARPHRVFLSLRVNAAVFYDITFFNLLFPSKKNLEIGLALVNNLNLSEMTAVLAHEFGHFAQRSMAVGRWVYMAQQVAGQIVSARSWLDKILAGLSRADLRVAWIGWIMRLIVWSLRSLLDTLFNLVILAQRALGREMEFQADLVSVSLTGSDALVNALHRLSAADGALSKAMSVAAGEASRGRAVPDLFSLQTRIIQRMGGILNEPEHGASPALPHVGREQHRVFAQELAEPPRMWSTHPGNRDREDNAKRVYVHAELDPRPAFCLFSDPGGLRRKATADFLKEVTNQDLTQMSEEAALTAVDNRFERPHLEHRYRGVYMGRSVVLYEKTPGNLYGPEVPEAALPQALTCLYPETLIHELRDLRHRQEEKENLEALHLGFLEAPGGVIRHRGQVISRRALPAVLAQVTSEVDAVEKRVEMHDRLCRTSHRMAARALGRGWEHYLWGLTALHHYAAHLEANVEDARGHLTNVISVVTADGRVSGGERKRLVKAAGEVYAAIAEVFMQSAQVNLSPLVMQRLIDTLVWDEDDGPLPKTWADVLPKTFALSQPTDGNMSGEYLRTMDGWGRRVLGAVGALERVSLELLVGTEAHVSFAYLNRVYPGEAPPPPAVPQQYTTLAPGQERSRQRRLGWWDRFQTADGFVPSVLRFGVAFAILGSVLAFTADIGHPSITVMNGLGLPVSVSVQGHTVKVEPGEHAELELDRQNGAQIVTKDISGTQIESRSVNLESSDNYIYNVAGAVPMVEWTATYGNATEVPDRELGAPVFFTTGVDHIFEQPPKSVSTKSGGSKRTALAALTKARPEHMLGHAKTPAERQQMADAHALWDPPNTQRLGEWLELAAEKNPSILDKRLAHYPNDMTALREQQDAAEGAAKTALCQKAAQQSQEHKDNLDLRYLSLRCRDDEAADKEMFDEYKAHPQHPYFANVAAYELKQHRDFKGALAAYATAATALPLADNANVERARLLRFLDQATDQALDALARDSDTLTAYLVLERGRDPDGDRLDGAQAAYALLDHGQLAQAVTAAAKDKDIADKVTRYVGASTGAGKPQVEAALALRGPVKARAALWPTIALAEREHRPHPQLDAQARESFRGYDKYLLPFASDTFLKGEKGDRAPVEAALYRLPIDLQPYACVMAMVRAPELAPGPCRKIVSTLLFASERPHFR